MTKFASPGLFRRVFGFEMGGEKGVEVQEKMMEEFCNEIPALFDPSLQVRRWFFLHPSGAAKSDERRWGGRGLVCLLSQEASHYNPAPRRSKRQVQPQSAKSNDTRNAAPARRLLLRVHFPQVVDECGVVVSFSVFKRFGEVCLISALGEQQFHHLGSGG